MELKATTTVTKPPDKVYDFWSSFDQFPSFMAHVDDIQMTGPRTSHWKVSAPFDREVEWDAETTEQVSGSLLSWRSKEGAAVANSGEVRFVRAPDGISTEVHVTLTYDAPGGGLGKALAKYFREDPSQHLDDDLRRFKQVMETGQVVRSDGAPWGKHARHEFPQRPAQPLSDDELKELQA
jgi:uncharacterized membrane protein